MFAAVKDFLYRHKRKFFYTGIAVGGFTLLSKYAEKKLTEWHEENTRVILEQHRRKAHYERTLNAARVMLLELLPTIRRVLERELDSDVLVQAIKDQPQNKKGLWEELKLVAFGRTVSSIVCVALAAPVLHIMMMVLASRTIESTDSTKSFSTATSNVAPPDVQTRYMYCLQQLVEQQLPQLVSKIMKVVKRTCSSLPLSGKVSLPQLESLLQQMTLDITNDRSVSGASPSQPCSVLPWSQYLMEPEPVFSTVSGNAILRDMYLTTVDILGTDDFNDVLNTIVQVGLNAALDDLAESFIVVQGIESSVKSVKHEEVNAKEDVEQEDSNASSGSSESFEALPKSEGCVTDPSSHKHASPDAGIMPEQSNYGSSSDVVAGSSMVVAKLVPILNSAIHKTLPDARHISLTAQGTAGGCLYNRLVVCSQLETLSYNIYDALIIGSSPPLTNA